MTTYMLLGYRRDDDLNSGSVPLCMISINARSKVNHSDTRVDRHDPVPLWQPSGTIKPAGIIQKKRRSVELGRSV